MSSDIYYCSTCDGTGEVPDEDTYDIAADGNDVDGPFTCEMIRCAACKGVGEFYDRPRGSDDGVEYGDPRDAYEEW